MNIVRVKEFFKVNKFEIIASIITLGVSLLTMHFSSLRYSTDDQFILFRYIDNIAEGKGFVYNVGEKVLGSTTPLFTLLAAFLKWIFMKVPTPDLVAYMNIVILSISTTYFYRVSKNFLSEKFSILAMIIFALSMSKTIPEGMESPLFILLLFVFLDFLLQAKYRWSAAVLAFLILTRPDAVLVALLVFMYWWKMLGWKETLKLSMLTVAVALPWLIFATIYFGSFIPQSVITKLHTRDIVNQSNLQAFKVQLSHLSRIYGGKFFDPNNILAQTFINLIPFMFLIFVALKKNLNIHNWIVFAIPISYFILFSISNPVMFPWYLSQIEPLWTLLSFIGLYHIWNNVNKRYIKLIILFLILSGPTIFWVKSVTIPNLPNEGGLTLAYYLKDNVKKGERIGVNNIGGIGYITNAYIIDFFGLTNDYAYAFYPIKSDCVDKSFQYIIPSNLIISTKPDWLIGGEGEIEKCLLESKWFKKNYGPAVINGVPSQLVWKLKK